MSNTIQFNGKPHKIGAFFATTEKYEAMTGKSITDCTTTADALKYFYCSLQAGNPLFDMPYTRFMEIMEENPLILADFKQMDAQRSGAKPVEVQNSVKKKPSKTRENFGLLMLSVLLLVLPVLIPIISVIGVLWTSSRLLYYSIVKLGSGPDSPPPL